MLEFYLLWNFMQILRCIFYYTLSCVLHVAYWTWFYLLPKCVLKSYFWKVFFESWYEGILSEDLFLNVHHSIIALNIRHSSLAISGACWKRSVGFPSTRGGCSIAEAGRLCCRRFSPSFEVLKHPIVTAAGRILCRMDPGLILSGNSCHFETVLVSSAAVICSCFVVCAWAGKGLR